MKNLKKALKKNLLNAVKIAVLGIGSELRGDDAAGILLAEQLAQSLRDIKIRKKPKVFIGATAPENITGEIKKFKPSHLVIVDAAQMGKEPGAVRLINADEVTGFSSCTHSLSLKIMADYLTSSIGCEIAIIGIQPKTTGFGSNISRPVKQSVKQISDIIIKVYADAAR